MALEHVAQGQTRFFTPGVAPDPRRILQLFLGTPGIDVFRPAGASAAVAVGYEHPIDLASCASVFPPDTYHVFWPNDRVDVLPGPLQLSDIADLTRVDL